MRLRSLLVPAAGAALALGLASPAWAHVELDPAEVKANTPTRLEVYVEHGCGTSPISKVVTRLPAEAVDVSADAPDGWTVSIAGNVVTWDGAAAPVPEDLRLGLTLTARADAGAVLNFPTVESCPNGEEIRWIEDVPDDGGESNKPLPRLRVVAGAPAPVTTAAAAPTTAAAPATTATPATTAAAPTTAAGATTTATTATGTTGTGAPTGGPPTTVRGEGGVNSTGGLLAGFGAAAVVVLGAGVLFLRYRRSAPGAR